MLHEKEHETREELIMKFAGSDNNFVAQDLINKPVFSKSSILKTDHSFALSSCAHCIACSSVSKETSFPSCSSLIALYRENKSNSTQAVFLLRHGPKADCLWGCRSNKRN